MDEGERITWKTLLGFLVLAAVIGMTTWPVAIWTGGENRALVTRLAAALFVACVLSRLARVVRADAGIGMTSAADRETAPEQPAIRIDPVLQRLAAELRPGLRWHAVPASVLERLRRLSLRRTGRVPEALEPRPGRRFTWREVARLVASLERAS